MKIENTLACSEQSVDKTQTSQGLNRDILDAICTLKPTTGFTADTGSKFLPTVAFEGDTTSRKDGGQSDYQKPDNNVPAVWDNLKPEESKDQAPKDNKKQQERKPLNADVLELRKGMIDLDAPVVEDPIPEAELKITLDQIKHGYDTKTLPPVLQNDVTLRLAIEDLVKASKEDPKHAQNNLDLILQNNTDIARVLENHFNPSDRTVDYESMQLLRWADRNLKSDEYERFTTDLNNFIQRGERDGICQGEVAKTLREIHRLTTAEGDLPITEKQRARIAQQILHQAAEPTSIDQGKHSTCNVTTIEARTYARTPAQAAKLVADVALTGQHRTADGILHFIDAQPHGESNQWPTIDGQRTHASEIFQVTAVNIGHNRSGDRNLRYEQHNPVAGDRADSGERLIDYSKKPPVEVKDKNGNPLRKPNLDMAIFTDVGNLISGRPEGVYALSSHEYNEGYGVQPVSSDEDLAARLTDAKLNKKLPFIVRVNTNNAPFYSDSGAGTAGGAGGEHVVTVSDYDPKTGLVSVDNQWGSKSDHTGRNAMSVHDLFTAMHSPHGAEKRLAADVKWNREHSINDPHKEMELVRMQMMIGTINDVDYQNAIKKFVYSTKESWKNGASEYAQKRDTTDLELLIGFLRPADQLNIRGHQYSAGMLSPLQFEDAVVESGWAINRAYNNSDKGTYARTEQAKGQMELERAMLRFNPTKQAQLQYRITNYSEPAQYQNEKIEKKEPALDR